MKKVYSVLANETTTIHVNNNIIEKIDTILLDKKYSSFFIICDQTTKQLFAQKVTKVLAKLKKPIELHTIPDGEDSKSIQSLFRILEHLIEKNFDRKSAIIAVGGGVVTDIATTAAGIFLRGIDCVHIPTTLLGQVDAAIGGKGAVNFRQYKNVIGIIKQPTHIIIDPLLLVNLPENQTRNGMGEVTKYAISLNNNLFSLLEKNTQPLSVLLPSIIEKCIQIKMTLVKKDPYEKTGIRQLLNFGHTLGHAIEISAHLPHGEAVSIGMVFAILVSEKLNMLEKEDKEKAINLLKLYNLPITLSKKDITKETIYQHMKKDKKAVDGVPLFVLLVGIGKVKTGCVVTKDIIDETLEEILV